MPLPSSTQYDLSAVEQFLSANHSGLASTSSSHAQVAIANDDTAGMSFSELFSHYLAPEVAKLPNSNNMPDLAAFPDTAFTFAGAGRGGAATSADPLPEFDPSTFMPSHVPGSPISPSETGSLSHSNASPMSFADFDDMFSSNLPSTDPSHVADPFAIDPSIFEQLPISTQPLFPPSSEASPQNVSLPALERQNPALAFPSTSTLPPLPDLAALSAHDLSLPPPPAHANFPRTQPEQPALTASGRPKRNVASLVVQEDDEEEIDARHDDEDEDDEDMSDTSEVTATRSTRRRSSKPPTTKKTRSNPSLAAASQNKKLAKTSVLPLASEGLYKTSSKSNLPPVPLWADKPDEDEYKKLSSKEKRQMRNKISARNFRHRRKEYITTLEEEISTRDNLITDLQDQVTTLRTDNSSLKSEVTLLKTKWQELLDKMSSLAGSTPAPVQSTAAGVGLGVNPSKAIANTTSAPVQIKEEDAWELDSPTSSASPLPSTSDAATTRRTRSSNGIQRPNLTKDVSARRSNSNWNLQGFGGGFQSVHTTLVPDFASLASHLTAKSAFSSAPSFNPNLNNLTADQLSELPSLTSHLRASAAPSSTSPSAFQDLFSSNPFYLNHASLESQRAGLYSRIAHNTAGLAQAKRQSPSSSDSEGSAPLPLPNGFRPAFFSTSSAPIKSSDKAALSSTAQELLEFQSPSSTSALSPAPSHQDAYQFKLAQMASQTLFSKMTGAFMNAFAGTSSSSTAWDSDKVKDVISGKATLQVVPVASTPSQSSSSDKKGLAALESQFGALDLGTRPTSQRARSLSPGMGATRKNCSFDEVVNRWTVRSEGEAKQ
ncbi:bZIP transcription factor [Sporobolomyces koalae]|uniref:bZIP transcription factor n=1 Tax=Sporobolomyces koalae TaxID=500713 RepID=UPI00317E19B7